MEVQDKCHQVFSEIYVLNIRLAKLGSEAKLILADEVVCKGSTISHVDKFIK